jgi:hypothetical protein
MVNAGILALIVFWVNNNPMPNVITLYHGTIHILDTVDVFRGKPFKDFGIGFYTSRDKEHASKMALRNREIEIARIRRSHKDGHFDRSEVRKDFDALLYTFELDLQNLRDLNVKEFKTADREWMRFVVQNLSAKERQHNFDMVIGPTANDNTLTAIGLFFAGAYGDVTSDNAVDRLIEQIEPDKLPHQYFFGSRKAAEMLVLKTRETLI